MNRLLEDRRTELVSKGKRGEREKGDGKTRYEKRVKSRFASSNRSYNKIDMNELFKEGILTVGIEVIGETNTYQVTLKFGGFLDHLRKVLERQNNVLDLRAVIRALVDSFNTDDVYVRCNCLHPDTLIKLLDGTEPTVEELKARFDKGESLFVYSVDEKGDFKPGQIEKVWIAGQSDKMIKVTLDTGDYIITTPDHPYMMRDGSYLPAEDLREGMSLMIPRCPDTACPGMDRRYNHKIKSVEIIHYEEPVTVYDLKVKEWKNFTTHAGVVLHNCEDYFYRFGYWNTVTKINTGEPQLIPSDTTNPKNTLGPGCKHLMLVLSNTGWVIKVASVIMNYVKYFEQHRQKEYADIIYPAIYNKEYEEPIQLSLDDKDELDSEETLLNKANEEGKARGQFKRGNKYRFQPQEKQNPDQTQLDLGEEQLYNII